RGPRDRHRSTARGRHGRLYWLARRRPGSRVAAQRSTLRHVRVGDGLRLQHAGRLTPVASRQAAVVALLDARVHDPVPTYVQGAIALAVVHVVAVSVVALLAAGGDDPVAADGGTRDTAPSLADIGLRARVPVVARAPIRPDRIRAGAVRGVADAHLVALIERRTDHRVRPGTRAPLTGVGLRAGVAVRA